MKYEMTKEKYIILYSDEYARLYGEEVEKVFEEEVKKYVYGDIGSLKELMLTAFYRGAKFESKYGILNTKED